MCAAVISSYIGFGQDVLAMVAFGLLLSLVFGAVVCGGLGSIARQKNIQVALRIVFNFQPEQVEDLEYGVETVFIVYLHLLTKLPMPQVLFIVYYVKHMHP